MATLPDVAVTGTVIEAAWGNDVRAAVTENPAYLAQAAGDLFVGSGPGSIARLPIGSPTQALRVNVGGDAVEWASADPAPGVLPDYLTGRYVIPGWSGPPASADEIESDRVYYQPIFVGRTLEYDRVSVEIITPGAPRHISVGQTNGESTSTIEVPMPSTHRAGDFLIAVIGMLRTSGSPAGIDAMPSGWTRIDTDYLFGGSNNSVLHMAYRVLTDDDDLSASDRTWTFNTSLNLYAGAIWCVRNLSDVSAINIVGAGASGTGTSITAPSVTTTVDYAMLLMAYYYLSGNAGTIDPEMTATFDQTSPPGASRLRGTRQLLGAAGATGTRTHTATTNVTWGARLLALSPVDSAAMRLGLYSAGLDAMPGELLEDYGEVDVFEAGVAEIAVSEVLPPGLYYLAYMAGLPVQLRHMSATGYQGAPLSGIPAAESTFNARLDPPAFSEARDYASGLPAIATVDAIETPQRVAVRLRGV